MGILDRFVTIMKSNINAVLDKCEDPAKMIDQTLLDLREDLAEVKKTYPKLASYMTRNISIMLSISSIHLLLIQTDEAQEKRRAMWERIREYNSALYYRLRYSTLSGLTYLPGRLGGKLTVGGYRFARRIYQFQ